MDNKTGFLITFTIPQPQDAELVLQTINMSRMEKEQDSARFNPDKLVIPSRSIYMWQGVLKDQKSLFASSALSFPSVYPLRNQPDRQICGFGRAYSSANSEDMIISNLFAVKSPYPTGSLFLSHYISQAQEAGYQSIRLCPINNKSYQWYKCSAGFEEFPVEDNNGELPVTKPNMILRQASFDKALKNLGTITQRLFSGKQNMYKVLDSMRPFP